MTGRHTVLEGRLANEDQIIGIGLKSWIGLAGKTVTKSNKIRTKALILGLLKMG